MSRAGPCMDEGRLSLVISSSRNAVMLRDKTYSSLFDYFVSKSFFFLSDHDVS